MSGSDELASRPPFMPLDAISQADDHGQLSLPAIV